MPAQEKVEKLRIELQETLDFDDLESKIGSYQKIHDSW